MSAGLRVPVAGLRQGPAVREWHLDDPGAVLGPLPDGIESVEVAVELSGEGRHGIRIRGRLKAKARVSCRRCLARVAVDVEADLDAWFREETAPGEESVWPLDADAAEVDVTAPVREELWLAMPEYVVCREDCDGLCPGCGVRLAEEECRCPPPEPDPRWGALDALRERVETPPEPGEDA